MTLPATFKLKQSFLFASRTKYIYLLYIYIYIYIFHIYIYYIYIYYINILYIHIYILYIYIFNCYLAAPRPTLGHYRGGSLTQPMLITCVLHIRPEGHREVNNEVGSLRLAQCLVGFELGTFQFWIYQYWTFPWLALTELILNQSITLLRLLLRSKLCKKNKI